MDKISQSPVVPNNRYDTLNSEDKQYAFCRRIQMNASSDDLHPVKAVRPTWQDSSHEETRKMQHNYSNLLGQECSLVEKSTHGRMAFNNYVGEPQERQGSGTKKQQAL